MLTKESALRKDRSTSTVLQHRHFAVIASIIRNMDGEPCKDYAAIRFANALGSYNPKFNRSRFLAACEVEE